jgi:hypothetical protein
VTAPNESICLLEVDNTPIVLDRFDHPHDFDRRVDRRLGTVLKRLSMLDAVYQLKAVY